MNYTNRKSLKFCFISNSNQSYLTDYINLNNNDSCLEYSFENLNLLELKNYNPNIIIIDEYFKDKDYYSIIETIKLNFKHTTIYFLSPEYSNYNSIIRSVNQKKHFYSNFSMDVLKQINNSNGIDNSNFLEAS